MVQSFRNLAGFGVMLVDTPSPENRLVLDERGEPRIQYQLSESDKQRFRQGIAEAVRVMFLAGAKEVYSQQLKTFSVTVNQLNFNRRLSPISIRPTRSTRICASFPTARS